MDRIPDEWILGVRERQELKTTPRCVRHIKVSVNKDLY